MQELHFLLFLLLCNLLLDIVSAGNSSIDLSCVPGRYYCGDQIRQLHPTAEENILYRCNADGLAFTNSSICDEGCSHTNNSGGNSHCSCTPKKTYCGWQLPEPYPQFYEREAIFICDDSGEKNQFFQACPSECLLREEDGKPHCVGRCNILENYCGYKLREELDWHGFDNDTVYECDMDGLNASFVTNCSAGTCESNMCRCTPGRYYCGYEMYDELAWTSDSLRVTNLRKCLSTGLEAETVNVGLQCPFCMGSEIRQECQCTVGLKCDSWCHPNTIDASWCQCKRATQYCGHELQKLGWNGYDNGTIFECVLGNNVNVVKKCKWDCLATIDGNPFCNGHCVRGRKYCASKLGQMGYKGFETNTSTLFLCEDDERSPPTDTGERNVHCTQQCIPGRAYCGHEMQYSHDIALSELQHKYKCNEAGNLDSIDICTICVNDGRGDAYCATPWYWIFAAVCLPLILILLGFIFVRSLIKHRRLKDSLNAQRIDADQLQTLDVLGNGEFGEVWRATYKTRKGISNDAALKVSKGAMDSAKKLACANCFLQEVVALDIVRHVNIIKAFGICTNYKDRFGNTIPAFVLEYMNGGSAISYLRSQKEHGTTTARDLVRIFTDIAQAGAHLCKLGIIHRDIGARNILIQTDSTNNCVKVAKLSDFGLAKDIGKNTDMYKSLNPDRLTIHCRYTAPEGFSGCFSSKSDVWSFGVFIWELYAVLEEDSRKRTASPGGPIPYAEIRDSARIMVEVHNGLRLKRPLRTPDDIYRIMLECWAKPPESRPSFKELVQFFSSKRGASSVQMLAASVCAEVADLPTMESDGSRMVELINARPNDGYGKALGEEEETLWQNSTYWNVKTDCEASAL